MSELDEIRRKKLEELKSLQQQKLQERTREEMQIQQLEMMVKQALTREALERYGNFKAAYPEKAVQLLVILAQAIQQGQLQIVDDNILKEVLKKLSPKKKDIKIKRV